MSLSSVEVTEAALLAKEVREIMDYADALGMQRPTQARAEEMARRNLETRT